MGDFFASDSDYQRLVEKIGPDAAARMAREQGWQVRPKEAQFTPMQAMGGGNMEDEDMNVANEDAADEAAADSDAADAYAGLGGLGAMDLSKPQDISRVILANARAQQRYYDDLAEQIKKRRYGPSESEKLFALSGAFFAPKSVRGFSGTMSKIMPVLQKFGELRRTGEENRQEALQELAQKRLAASKGDVTNMLALQRLMASQAKAGQPQFVFGSDNAFRIKPGTGGYPRYPDRDAYGNFVITDPRQLDYLPVNSKVVEPGQDPTKPKYVPARG